MTDVINAAEGTTIQPIEYLSAKMEFGDYHRDRNNLPPTRGSCRHTHYDLYAVEMVNTGDRR